MFGKQVLLRSLAANNLSAAAAVHDSNSLPIVDFNLTSRTCVRNTTLLIASKMLTHGDFGLRTSV